jgi:glycerol-1-phosphate dehydrogenase [NAD(P)+]
MDFSQIFFDESPDEREAAAALGRRIRDIGIEAPVVLCSPRGALLAAGVVSPHHVHEPPAVPDQAWASELGSTVHKLGADALIAIGGGRTLDVGKLAAARAGVVVVSVPTQLSHDGICSPVSVVPDTSGTAQSLGAITPRAVFISIATLRHAPVAAVRAGVGDLLANPFALRDWKLAADRGLDEIDERAWKMSENSYAAIEPHLTSDLSERARDPEFLKTLANSLILSGMAMVYAGTSRPASGAEHEISHAIDKLFGGRAMHGAQVAFGCTISAALYGDDVSVHRGLLGRLELPHHPSALDLSEDDMVAVVLEAPQTRPGRFTILEEADLDKDAARELVRRVWGPWQQNTPGEIGGV